MAVDAEIVVGVRGDVAGGKTVKRSLDDISKSGAKAVKGSKELENQFKKTDSAAALLRRTMVALGVSFGLRELQQLVDTYTNIQNRLKLVTDSTSELVGVTRELFEVANETRISFESTAELYARTALATKELGLSQRDTIEFTRSLNQAVVLSGASAIEANAGLIQLSQGLASGTLRGDELRSVLEQLPAVADVIAKGLGVTRGELRKMGEQGKITADIVIDAFAKAKVELDEKFGQTVPTIGQSFVVLRNNVIEFTGELDKATGASSRLAEIILTMADNINTLAKVVGIAAGTWLTYRAALLLATGAAVLQSIAGSALAFVQLAATVRSVATATLLLNTAFLTGPGALVAVMAAVAVSAFVFRDELRASILAVMVEIIIAVDKASETMSKFLRFSSTGLEALRQTTFAKLGLIDEDELQKQLLTLGKVRDGAQGVTDLSPETLRARRDEVIAGFTKGEDRGTVSTVGGVRTTPTGVSDDVKGAQKELAKLIKNTSTEQETLIKRIKDLENLRGFANTEAEIQAIDRALEVANEQLLTASDILPGMEDHFKSLKDSVDGFSDSAGDAFGEIITGSKSAGEAISDLLRSFASDLASQGFSALTSSLLGSVLGGLGGGGDSAGASAGSSFIGSAIGSVGSLFGFDSGGSMVLGGDAGIDQNVLSLNGSPIAKTGRGETLSISPTQKSGKNVVVNQTINISTGVQETVRAEIIQALPAIESSVKAAVQEDNLRGIS